MNPSTLILILSFLFSATIVGLLYYIFDRRQQGEAHREALLDKVLELEALNDASRAIVSAELDQQALVQHIANEAGKIIDNNTFQIGLFENELYHILFWRVAGLERATPATYNLATSPNAGLIGWIRTHPKPLLVHDFEEDLPHLPAQPRYVSENPPRSGLFIPLLHGNQVIGVIAAQHAEPNVFDESDAQRLSIIANQSAAAIANARLYQQARIRADDLASISELAHQVNSLNNLDAIFAHVVHIVHNRLGFHHVMIFSIDPHRVEAINEATDLPNMPRGLLRVLPDVGVVGAVLTSHQTLILNDVSLDARYRAQVGIREYDEIAKMTRAEMAIPLLFDQKLVGILDVQSDKIGRFTQREQTLLEALASEIAVAIDKAQKAVVQKEWNWNAEVQYQVARTIYEHRALDEMLRAITRLTALLFGTPQCGVVLWDEERELYRAATIWGVDVETTRRYQSYWFPQGRWTALDASHIGRTPYVTDQSPPWFDAPLPAPLLLCPLQTDDERQGALFMMLSDLMIEQALLQNPRWQEMLKGLAKQLAQGIERAILREKSAERAKLTQELTVALQIQASLIPQTPPRIPPFEIATFWEAARQVSGDFFDFMPLPNNRWGMVIADVSGKGMPAAIFMAMCRTIIRSVAFSPFIHTPQETLQRVNEIIRNDSSSDMFVTAFYAIWDPLQQTLCYVNGGHNPPLICTADGQVQIVGQYGIALGVIVPISLAEEIIPIRPGETVLLYTDGVTEAFNGNGEAFGLERLKKVVAAERENSAASVVSAITTAIKEHAQGTPPTDDVTLVVLKSPLS